MEPTALQACDQSYQGAERAKAKHFQIGAENC